MEPPKPLPSQPERASLQQDSSADENSDVHTAGTNLEMVEAAPIRGQLGDVGLSFDAQRWADDDDGQDVAYTTTPSKQAIDSRTR